MLALYLCLAGDGFARPLIADLSLRSIPIDSGFKGIDILLFGARNDGGDIVVVIRGPEMRHLVRKKERIAGIWVNRRQMTFDGAYGYYAVASNRALQDIQNDQLLKVLNIGMDNLNIRPINANPEQEKAIVEEFKKALLAEKTGHALYSPVVAEVSFIGDTLFRTYIHFPENISRGIYSAEVYLFNAGQLVGMQSTPLKVYKTGFDAFVYDLAYQHSAIYGIVAILLALLAGWGAGMIFKRV